MKWLSDAALDHLREVAGLPDLSGTRYLLVERLAQGGMGTIYVVEDRELGRQVALKVLSDAHPSTEALLRLEREARILARLEHPSIVPIHERGVLGDGRTFYTMKLVRGDRLDQVAGKGASTTDLLRIFERICEAVRFAHAHGVIHRDLKPQNVMVGPFGEVLVMDWGVAKLKEGEDVERAPTSPPIPASDQATAHGTIVGTPAYMAPEQKAGRLDLVDESTDVYALGAILHFILTGRAPAEAGSHRRVPRRLNAICEKAMAPDGRDRYKDVSKLAQDVSCFLLGEPVAAYREGLLERTGRWAVKHRTPIALVLAYLLMRALLLFFFPRT